MFVILNRNWQKRINRVEQIREEETIVYFFNCALNITKSCFVTCSKTLKGSQSKVQHLMYNKMDHSCTNMPTTFILAKQGVRFITAGTIESCHIPEVLEHFSNSQLSYFKIFNWLY